MIILRSLSKAFLNKLPHLINSPSMKGMPYIG